MESWHFFLDVARDFRAEGDSLLRKRTANSVECYRTAGKVEDADLRRKLSVNAPRKLGKYTWDLILRRFLRAVTRTGS